MSLCSHCNEKVRLDNGVVAYHDWPKPCRQICPGSKKPPAVCPSCGSGGPKSISEPCMHCEPEPRKR